MCYKEDILSKFPYLADSSLVFRSDGHINPSIISKYPDLARYCQQIVDEHPEYEKPSFFIYCVLKDVKFKSCCVCGKLIPYSRNRIDKITCSEKCAKSKEFFVYKQTLIDKANMEKYGVRNAYMLPEFREKAKKTCLKKYGATSFSKTKEWKEKVKQTSLERYGTTCSLYNPEIRAKMLADLERKYGKNATPASVAGKHSGEGERRRKARYQQIVKDCEEKNITPLFSLDEYKGLFNGKGFHRYPFKCNVCGNEWEWYIYKPQPVICRMCHPKNFNVSTPENDIASFVQSLGFKLQRNCRHIIAPYELDIFISDEKIAIEHNGVYFHREGRKTFHQKKRDLCEERGIHLIQIFEDEWMHKRRATKAKLKSILGRVENKIQADKCSVDFISQEKAKAFVEKYAIEGWLPCDISCGLFYKDRLVNVMSFKKCLDREYDYELVSYCSLFCFDIVSGAARLLDFFRTSHNGSIVARMDRRWSDSSFYGNLGFTHIENSAPVFWYCKKDYRFPQGVQKESIPEKLIWDWDDSLSTEDNLKKNKFFRVWDCGCSVFVIR